jgi:nicotinamide-nucleotide amidase
MTETAAAKQVARTLKTHRLTLAVAEAATGGMVGDLLLRLPGASAYFPGAVVTYSRQSRVDLLGVSAEVVADHGTVSEETVKAMATGVRERFHADLGLASTGIAGPTGGSPGRPVGLVWLALATAEGTTAMRYESLAKGRVAVQRDFTLTALRWLLEQLAT